MKFRKLYYQSIHDAKLAANNIFIKNSHNKCKAARKIVHNTENNGNLVNEKCKIPISPTKLNNYFVNVPVNMNSYNQTNVNNKVHFMDLVHNMSICKGFS
ncbi:hypothetical protein J6590_014814 [Homalodisca vitripennis]|nr:hypothetical protein J6590_014814 [Homalodisca vitripennis]